MLTIEQTIQLPEGDDFYLYQDEKSDLVMYVPKSGKLQKLRTETNHGTYVPLVWKGEASDVDDSGILELEGDNSGDTVLLLFGKKNDTRILKI